MRRKLHTSVPCSSQSTCPFDVEQIRKSGKLTRACSYCQKIYDDAGDWHTVESDDRGFPDLRLTHGICPACAHSLYPEVFADKPLK